MRNPVLLLALLACGCGSTDAMPIVPALWTYKVDFTASYPTTTSYSATIRIDTATPDQVTGVGVGGVARVNSPLLLGFWNGDAYAVHVDLDRLPRLQLRITRTFSGCSGSLREFDRTDPVTACTISKVAP